MFTNPFPSSKPNMAPSVPKRVTFKGNPFGYRVRQQLEPLASGLQSMFSNLFDGFSTNMNKQQQEQDSELMSYLPILGIGIIGIFLIKK